MRPLLALSLTLLGEALLANVSALVRSAYPGQRWTSRVEESPPLPSGTGSLHSVQLAKRQDTSTESSVHMTIAPDEVCGYISGEIGLPWSCDPNTRCSWIENFFAFCGDDSLYTTCWDQSIVNDPDLCDVTCQLGDYDRRCNDDNFPYCMTLLFPSSVTYFRCAVQTLSGEITAEHTFEGQIDARFETSTLVNEITTDDSSTTPTGSSTTDDFSTSPTVPSTTEPTDSSTTTPQVPATTSSDPEPDGRSRDNTGAIVGGVVGGVVAIALVGLAFYFVHKRYAGRPNSTRESSDLAVTSPVSRSAATSPSQDLSGWRQSTVSGGSTVLTPGNQQSSSLGVQLEMSSIPPSPPPIQELSAETALKH